MTSDKEKEQEDPDLVCDLIDIFHNATNAAKLIALTLQAREKDVTEVMDYEKFGIQVSFHVTRALQLSKELIEFAEHMHHWAEKAHSDLKVRRFKDEQH